MELGIYDIIKGTISTPKSILLRKKLGTITLRVNKLANKVMIRGAVEKIWNVKVKNVRIINLAGKAKMVGRIQHYRTDTKKALISLMPGYKIDLPDQFESMGINETEHKGDE